MSAAAPPAAEQVARVREAIDSLCHRADRDLVGAVAGCAATTRAQRRRSAATVADAALAALADLPRPRTRGGGIAHASDGRPTWPAGVVGSISHGAGATSAIVGPSSRLVSVGVDVERASALDPDDARVVLTAGELELVASAADPAGVATVLWSAKEAAFKAWSAAASGALPSLDPRLVTVEVDLAAGRFEASADPEIPAIDRARRRVAGFLAGLHAGPVAAPGGAVATLCLIER